MTNEELFPHFGFPVRLEYTDRGDHKICWFQNETHLEKHLTRYKLKRNEVRIDRNDLQNELDLVYSTIGEPAEPIERKPVRRVSKPKSNKRKSRTAEATNQPKKRGRPRKVKDN